MSASNSTAKSPAPARPGLVMTTDHNISYRSRTGRTLTFEFKPTAITPGPKPPKKTSHASEANPFANLTPLTSSIPASAATATTTPGSEHDNNGGSTPRGPATASTSTNADDALAGPPPGVLLGVFDTLSFWCMEAVEVAMWGPYDEAAPTPGLPTGLPQTPGPQRLQRGVSVKG